MNHNRQTFKTRTLLRQQSQADGVAQLDLVSHVAKDSKESLKDGLECIDVEILPLPVPESQVPPHNFQTPSELKSYSYGPEGYGWGLAF